MMQEGKRKEFLIEVACARKGGMAWHQKKDLLNRTAPREEKNDAGRHEKDLLNGTAPREEMRDGRASKERSFERNSSARGNEGWQGIKRKIF
jgi:hypothetical protein